MVPYFQRHGCKQFMRNKPLNFGYKWYLVNTYMGKDENYDPTRGACWINSKLPGSLPNQDGSNYHHIVVDTFSLVRLYYDCWKKWEWKQPELFK